MKNRHWITLFGGIAIVLGIYAIFAVAQPPTAETSQQKPCCVAVVDLAQAIKMHPDFAKKQDALKAKTIAAEAEFQAWQETITAKQEALKEYAKNSDEYTQAAEKIDSEAAIFKSDAEVTRRKLMSENAKIMYETYQDIKSTAAKVAAASGISLVMDYRHLDVNPADPESVAEAMDQRIVWFESASDITESVIAQFYKDRGEPVPTAQ